MRRFLVVAAVTVAVALLTPAANAAAGDISITGGGTSENAILHTVRTIGFNAHVDAAGTAKGQVQIKNVATDTGVMLLRIHGDVVCVAETSGVTGGDGWEVRFLITKSSGPLAFFMGPEGSYMSVYVRDLPDGDQIDDHFSLATKSNPACGANAVNEIIWDDVLNGQITVHA